MAYVLNGVEVLVSEQAVRPREPARPQPAAVLTSSMMATRQMRPRESVPTSVVTVKGGVVPATKETDKYLAAIVAARGKQATLQKLLTGMGVDLARANAAVVAAGNNRDLAAAAKAQSLMIQKDISVCIDEIKACAAAANTAASAAIATGASRADVKDAGAAGAAMMQIDMMPKNAVDSGAVLVPGGGTSVVESNTATLQPDGTIQPGADAQVITTPSSGDPGADVVAQPADITVSTGSASALAFIGAAAVIGYLVLRKKNKA